MSETIIRRTDPAYRQQPFNQPEFYKPSLAANNWTIKTSLCARALMWLFPWTRRSYPGLHRACSGLAGGRVVYQSIHFWRTGKTPVPVWYAEILADTIEARVMSGDALLKELREYIEVKKATPRPIYGACAVWADGKDRRGAKRKIG